MKNPAQSDVQERQENQIAITPANMNYANPESIQQGETYHHYGGRMCGRVNGDTNFLTPFLQRVYYSERQKQANDEVLQEAAREDIRGKISDKRADLENTSNLISEIEDKIQECRRLIEEWRNNISQLRIESGQGKNKEAKVKMILGCVILIPLTFYLFVFYSSTFYSAFFRDFMKEGVGIGTAMFDPNAISTAYANGITELFFILAAPVIFLGLGFSLHYFTLQKNKIKYLKMGAIIVVTFIFDCILAYLIGKKIYEVQLIYTDLPPYSISEAISDPNIWAVIFCGFVVYIIWGIVFDMTMTAYNDFTTNKSRIDRYEKQIADENIKMGQLQGDKSKSQTKKTNLSNEITKLEQSLSTSITHFDMGKIKSSLSDFFAGWMALLASLKPSEAPIATSTYNQTLKDLNLEQQ